MHSQKDLASGGSVALVVDLDGTLLRSDLLLEMGLAFLRDQPARFFAPLLWLLRGKAALKHELASATDLDVSALPYDRAVIEFIEAERRQGRRVVLATASHRLLAERVAAHLPLFDAVLATDAARNLSAEAKRDALVETFGRHGFDYVGDSLDDLPVWAAARRAYVVNPTSVVERRARKLGNVAAVLRSDQATPRDWVRALRMHQWLKNLLLFVPLFAAHAYTDPSLVLDALVAFLCFCLCSSSVYVLNDLLDLREDRRHASKRSRPFASGRLPILAGLVVLPVLLAAAFALALWQLPALFVAILAAYYVLTLAYSVWLKRHMVVDVITLAALYTLRVVAGGVALSLAPSFWLLAFSMFIFLSLALVKRYAELYDARAAGHLDMIHGRGYSQDDLEMVAALGAAAGYMSVMVLALYINQGDTTRLYRRPEIIWLACPLLLTWVSRLWMLAHRGRMHEDPVIFAIEDRTSVVIGVLMALVFWAAT